LAEDGRRVFAAAVRAAQQGENEYIGTEHLLIGITTAGPTPALVALQRANINVEDVRHGCNSLAWPGKPAGQLPLTPALLRVFATALREAEERGEERVGSLTLLLALAREPTGVAREFLVTLTRA
jgi:ATP-dependent Clp protease ATP-binding subunit ClpC